MITAPNVRSVPHRVIFGDDKKLLECMLHPPDGESLWGTPGFNVPSFPSGLSNAPFRWCYLDRSFDMDFLAGSWVLLKTRRR